MNNSAVCENIMTPATEQRVIKLKNFFFNYSLLLSSIITWRLATVRLFGKYLLACSMN